MFGLSIEKIIVVIIVIGFIIGPSRLPLYATKLADFVKAARRLATDARGRLSEEMGPEFDEVDWKKLDPRQYDPRRIIRTALLDDDAPKVTPPAKEAPPSRVE